MLRPARQRSPSSEQFKKDADQVMKQQIEPVKGKLDAIMDECGRLGQGSVARKPVFEKVVTD